MTTSLLNLFLAALVLAIFQVLAAIPWVSALDNRPFRKWVSDTTILSYLGGGTLALAGGLTWYIRSIGDLSELERFGRYYGAIFHLQLIFDFIVLAPRLLLLVWPKAGAVAIAAYREALRQPMFWVIFGF